MYIHTTLFQAICKANKVLFCWHSSTSVYGFGQDNNISDIVWFFLGGTSCQHNADMNVCQQNFPA